MNILVSSTFNCKERDREETYRSKGSLGTFHPVTVCGPYLNPHPNMQTKKYVKTI